MGQQLLAIVGLDRALGFLPGCLLLRRLLCCMLLLRLLCCVLLLRWLLGCLKLRLLVRQSLCLLHLLPGYLLRRCQLLGS